MKSVLMSIKPKWCELIDWSCKTIEIRKTKPKIEAPFKCYIYCTKQGEQFFHGGIGEKKCLFKNPNTGFIHFDYPFKLVDWEKEYSEDNFLSGKVIGEFVCNDIFTFEAEISRRKNVYEAISLRRESEDFSEYADFRYSLVSENGDNDNWLMNQSCVMWNDLKKYLGYKSREFYGWRIRNLEIYKNPKRLSEFGLTRPPQDWCYVKELTK